MDSLDSLDSRGTIDPVTENVTMVGKIKRWVKSVLSMDGTLSKRKERKRGLFCFFNLFCLMATVASVPANIEVFQLEPMFGVAYGVVILVSLLGVLAMVSKMNMTPGVIVLCAYGYGFATFLSDLTNRVKGETMWAPLVLIVDLLLVMEVPTRYTVVFVAGVTVWLCAVASEEMFRFGLFDLPGLLPQHGVHGRWELHRKQGECTELPCARDSGLLVSSLAVFLIDFIATRGFARDILREQKSMERTINAVQEIASLLAGYDVEEVAELLEAHEHELPEGMTTALRSLEQNLRVYKAYLPQTCLSFERRATEACELHEVSFRTGTTDASLSSVSSGGGRRKTLVQQTLDLSFTNATLLTLNIKDTLHRLEEDRARFSDLFTTLLQKTLQATEVRRGMVDVFVGDRIHCSFNTSKQCAPHATSALHAATLLLRCDDIAPHVNMGVATGRVLRGDMGCEVMRRFSMVGTLVHDVNVLERAGRVLGCNVLCNRLCFSDGECEHDLRLVPCKVEVGESRVEVVAELVVLKEAVAHRQEEEWMYMLQGNKQCDEYNTAVRGYLRGNVSASQAAAAAAIALGKPVGDNSDGDIPEFSEVCEVLQLPVQTRQIANMNTNSSDACVK